jgi:hypothetical protein
MKLCKERKGRAGGNKTGRNLGADFVYPNRCNSREFVTDVHNIIYFSKGNEVLCLRTIVRNFAAKLKIADIYQNETVFSL